LAGRCAATACANSIINELAAFLGWKKNGAAAGSGGLHLQRPVTFMEYAVDVAQVCRKRDIMGHDGLARRTSRSA